MVKTWCPQCGPNVHVDEDGCCLACGATACGYGANLAHELWRGDHHPVIEELLQERLRSAERQNDLLLEALKAIDGHVESTLAGESAVLERVAELEEKVKELEEEVRAWAAYSKPIVTPPAS